MSQGVSLLYKLCMVFLGLSYLPFMNQVSLRINSAMFFFVTLSIWQESGQRRIPTILRGLLLICSLALVFDDYGTLRGLEPGVAALSLLAALKTFELSTKRDFFLFVLIVELALVGHVLTVDDLYMVSYVVILSVSLFGLLFTFHSGDRAMNWTKARRKVFGQIFLYSLPLALGLFLVFPRLTLGNLFFNTINKSGASGFSDEIRPGSLSEVILNSKPYFRASFKNGKSPSNLELYWRGAVLSRTDGFTWKRVKVPDNKPTEYKGRLKYAYTVDFNDFANSPLYFLEDTETFKKLSQGHMINLGGGTLKFYPISNQKISYEAQTRKSIPLKMNEKFKDHYLQLPKIEKRKRFSDWALAQKDKIKNLRGAANFFSGYLKKEGFSYTLKPGFINGKSPLDTFFFERKVGFCEHFASSFAIFLRHLNIPSRVVAGFQGGQYNPLGNYYVVRGRDAHAWVEAYEEGRGWVRLDPTNWIKPSRVRFGAEVYFAPQDTEEVSLNIYLEKQNNDLFQRLLFAVDMLYYEANREFVGFDIEKQKNLFSFLGTDSKNWPWKLMALLFGICGIIFLPLYYRMIRGSRNRDYALSQYSDLIKKIERAGLKKDHHWGPQEMERRSAEIFPSSQKELAEAFALFRKIRYEGMNESSKELILKMRRIVRSLKLKPVESKFTKN